MSDEVSTEEAIGRLALAAQSYKAWPTEQLWEEFILLSDEAWEGRETPEPVAWAKREAIGLALIGRGASAADLARGYPLKDVG